MKYQAIIDKLIYNMDTLSDARWAPAWVDASIENLPNVVTSTQTKTFDAIMDEYYKRERITYIEKAQNKSFYAPDADIIMLPEKKQFKSIGGYYAVKAHETIHSTGEYTRCFREGFDEFKSISFGSAKYSREELAAEIGACFLLDALKIDTQEAINSASVYLYNWRSKLNNNNKWIYDASGLAQEAVEFILEN